MERTRSTTATVTDQAGGGALPTAVWNVFARDLGFGPEMLVDEATGEPPATPAAVEITQPELFPAP